MEKVLAEKEAIERQLQTSKMAHAVRKRIMTRQEGRIKELESELKSVTQKADCYERLCEELLKRLDRCEV